MNISSVPDRPNKPACESWEEYEKRKNVLPFNPNLRRRLALEIAELVRAPEALEHLRNAFFDWAANHDGPALPLEQGVEPTLPEKKAILVGIHDSDCHGRSVIIRLADVSGEKAFTVGIPYYAMLKEHIPALRSDDEEPIRQYLEDVRVDMRRVGGPLRPFDPNRKQPVQSDGKTLEAVRRVLPDWDGENWEAVRAVLRRDGLSDAQIACMDIPAVRQHFAVGQKPIILKLGGRPHTTDATIVEEVGLGCLNVTPGETKGAAAGDARGSHKLSTPTEDSRTSYDKVLDWCKNNRLIVVVLIIVVFVTGAAGLISGFETISKCVTSTLKWLTSTFLKKQP